MDERQEAAAGPQTLDASIELEESPLIEATSQEYLGRWNRLVSTTNWEKGRIICQWREALIAGDSPPSSYTDEAWSRRAGSVTPQHTGRLRRTYQRFGATYDQYEGLYWSHFQVVLDWDDAEMWLEGAVQSGWSVARMRDKRWESIGAPPELKPRDADIIVSELDEDTSPAGEPPISESLGEVRPADADDRPAELAGDDSGYGPASESLDGLASESLDGVPFRPFENVPSLPSDLNEAVESMKLAILHHKVSGWEEISRDDVLVAIEALKQLVLSPAE